ncbi:hypothetical protein JCM6882_007291 [Rhodosporidiobolus microsporus]
MSSQFGLPAVLTSSTLDELLLRLDTTFYPPPTPGFPVRWWVLTGITVAYILLNILYLFLHVKYSSAGWQSMWLIRRIDRPSGRFIVTNARLAWFIPIVYGLFELVYLVLFIRVYEYHTSQLTWFAIRSLNAPLLFVVGWLASWSGLQAFLVAIESNDEHFLPAWVANTVFLVGGGLLFLLNLGLAIATSVLGTRFWLRYEDLRTAIVAVQDSLGGRVPTLIDLIPLQAPSTAFATASDAWQNPAIAQYAITALLPAGCLLVNLGGLALARRLHVQIRDSVEVLALVEARRTSIQRGIPLDDLSSPSKPRGSASTSSVDGGDAEPERVSYVALEEGVVQGKGKDKRKPSLTNDEVKVLAKQRDAHGEPAATQAQARKVLSLQKAMRDLVIIAATIAVVALAFLVDATLVAVWSSTHAIYKGHWPITEAAISLPAWIYSVPVFVAVVYLNYNAVVIGRLTAQPASSYAAGSASKRRRSHGASPALFPPSTGSVVCHFVDQARSAPEGPLEDVDLLPSSSAGRDEEANAGRPAALGERRRSSVVSTGLPPTSPQGGRRTLRLPGRLSPWGGGRNGGGSSGGRAGGRNGHHHHGGERPNSIVSQGIVFTVETERVCEGDTCDVWAREERGSRFSRGGESGGGGEEGRRSPLE